MLPNSVNFLMSGPGHLPYLVVALKTLRQYYDGIVTVYAYPESFDIVKIISNDPRFDIDAVLWKPIYTGKNGQFFNKLRMMQNIRTPFGVYLDADVIVTGHIDGLFRESDSSALVATQFCDWVTTGSVIRGRLSRLVGREGIDQDIVTSLLNRSRPSVNGGVFAVYRDSMVLRDWEISTGYVLDIFIADETVLHMIVEKWGCSVLDGTYNCSPKHKPQNMDPNSVKIWHGHGDCFLRKSKSSFGFDLWSPLFRDVVQGNYGGIRDWLSRIEYKYLNLTELGVDLHG